MRKKLAAALLAAFLLSAGAARADNLYISGLGTLPFDRDIAVTDGAGTAVEGMIRRQASAPQERNTKRNRLMRFLTVPGGMTLADGTAHSPAAGARLWQLVKKETHGTYTMLAVAFSGDGTSSSRKAGKRRGNGWKRSSARAGSRRKKKTGCSSRWTNFGTPPRRPWRAGRARRRISASSMPCRGRSITMTTALSGGSRA